MDNKTNEEKRAFELKTPWERLIDSVKNGKCNDAPFDTKTFTKVMRDTFEYFFSEDAVEHELTKAEISLLCSLYTYTKLPNFYENESYENFKKSQHAVSILSFVILFRDGKNERVSGNKLHHVFFEDDKFKIFEYDIMTDDMGEFRDKYPTYEEGDYSWRGTIEDGSEYGVYPEDYDNVIEYLDDLEEAKYEWRLCCEDGSKYRVNPYDYETEDEYSEALAKAKAEAE